MAIHQVRRENLLILVGEYPRRVFCERTGLAASDIRHLIAGHQDIDEEIARQVEAGLKLPKGWMDLVHPAPDSEAAAMLKDLPAQEQAVLAKFRQLDPLEQAHIETLMDALLAVKRAANHNSGS